ncbi:MAG: hypothetical protein AAB605_01735 [Patescibacteria group bacterium]
MKNYAIGFAAMLCAVCVPFKVVAQEVQPFIASVQKNMTLDQVALENAVGRALAQRHAEQVCDDVAQEPAICKLEFEVVDQAFYVANQFIMIAKIAHPGEQQDDLKEKAQWWSAMAEHLDMVALTDTLSLKGAAEALSTASEAAKVPPQ